MKSPPITREQTAILAAVLGATGGIGWWCRDLLSDSHAVLDYALLSCTAVAGTIALVALRRSNQLRRQLERRAKALEISEERHRLLLEQASDAIIVFDADTGNIIEANRYACEVLGRRESELLGRSYSTIAGGAGRTLARSAFDHQVQAGGVIETEISLQHSDGAAIPMQMRSSVVTTGARRYVQAILRDLRPRLKAEEALRRSEGRLREVFERVPVAIVEKDLSETGTWLQALRAAGVSDLEQYLHRHPDELRLQLAKARIIGANPTALRSAGAPDLETYARKIASNPLPSALRVFELELEALWDGRSELVCEAPFRRVDGSTGQSVMHWNVTRIDGCMDLRRVVVVYSDLSDLRAAEARLREVEDRWELAVRALNVGIFEKNYVTGEVFTSDRWKEMIGFTPQELPNSAGEWHARIHPEDRDRVIQQLQSHLRGENEYYRVEYRMLCKDGAYKWISARGRAYFAADGHPQRLVGAHTDISEQRKAEAALRASEVRHRELFDRTPVAVLEEDFSEVGTWLHRRNITSPDELDSLIAREPGALCEAYRSIKLLAANRQASAHFALVFGAADMRLQNDPLPSVLQAFRHELLAILTGRDEVNAEVELLDARGRRRHQSVRWAVGRREDGTLDLSRVLLVLVDVTDIRVAEESARRAEERWQLAVRGTQDGIWEINFQTGERFFSDRWCEMLGYTREQIATLSGRWADHMHPEDCERVQAIFEAHRRRETEYFHCEYRLRAADGSYKWILSRGQATFDSGGRALRMLGSHTDITERTLSEAALRESESRFRILFEHLPVALVEQDYTAVRDWMEGLRAAGVTDLAGYLSTHSEDQAHALSLVRTVNFNRETVRIVRASSKEELMAKMTSLFTPGTYQARLEAFLAVWAGRKEIEGEIALRALDGTERHLFFRWWLPDLGGRRGYESTQLVLVDLTDVKRAEAALAAERERLRVMLRAMAEGLLTTDTSGVVQFMNEAAERLTGWSSGEAVGRKVEDVCVLRHEKTRAAVAVPFTVSISEHRVVDFPLRTMLVSRRGGQCLVDGRCAPMHDLSGMPLGAVVVFRDVTERARLESELLRSSKLESVGILAGGIAHDFNNILTVVMGNVTLAMMDQAVMAAAGRWLGEAERGVMRARDLTQQLLTFAKGGEPVRKTVQLPEVVREAAEFALHGSKVRCDFHFESGLLPADVDKGQIGQVIQNLVINAVQAMPEGGEISIAIDNEDVAAMSPRPLPMGKYLRLVIADKGTGIRSEHLAHIFDPYFTTKQSGSGLGLATVYSIVRRHQGRIDVESELGKGTTFFIWLPAASTPTSEETETPVSPRATGGRLLFMDDEETIRALAEALLSKLGFEVVTVPDGQSAIEAYAEARASARAFDLVIMDLTVPGGMGGREAMENLLRMDPGVRAIVSSGYSSDPVLSNFRSHGFRGVVPKPYKLTDLARVVNAVLNEKT